MKTLLVYHDDIAIRELRMAIFNKVIFLTLIN